MFNAVYTITHGSDANSIEIKSESFHYFRLYWINLEIPMCTEIYYLLFLFFLCVCVCMCVFIICCSLCIIEFKSETIAILCDLSNLL